MSDNSSLSTRHTRALITQVKRRASATLIVTLAVITLLFAIFSFYYDQSQPLTPREEAVVVSLIGLIADNKGVDPRSVAGDFNDAFGVSSYRYLRRADFPAAEAYLLRRAGVPTR